MLGSSLSLLNEFSIGKVEKSVKDKFHQILKFVVKILWDADAWSSAFVRSSPTSGAGANGWNAADVDLSPSKTRLVSSLWGATVEAEHCLVTD